MERLTGRNEAAPPQSNASTAAPDRGQLTFPIERERFPDRNFHKGGRSFYFFDFDDNIMFLATPIYLFEAETGRELALSTGQFARVSHLIGKAGPYARYHLDLDEQTGSFRRFRDTRRFVEPGAIEYFVQDIAAALEHVDLAWKGPSWAFFEHAVHNGRPLAIITARGHAPQTIAAGIELLRDRRHLPCNPNYLGIYPVTHALSRRALGDPGEQMSVPELKKAAIVDAVEMAMARFGANPHHRFGISDDSPANVELAVAALTELKRRYADNAFFVFDASREPMLRLEIEPGWTVSHTSPVGQQLTLFDP